MRIFVDDYLQVRYINLYNEKVTDDLKILAISDIHISNLVSFKKIKRIERQFLKEKADYIVFVGDLIDRVEEINNSESLFKLKHLLEFSAKVAKTFVVLGNHDYIHRENYSSYKEKISLVIKNIQGITLLDNDVYSDDELWLMGYTETIKYYRRKNYDFTGTEYERYFQDKSWYSPVTGKIVKEEELNRYEKANIDFLADLEKQYKNYII